MKLGVCNSSLLSVKFFVDSAEKSWWEVATVDKKDDALPWTQAGNYTQSILTGSTTGRQPPPLYSILYGIISVVQLLLREKSGVKIVGTDSNYPSLPGGSMKFIWWN
jgi:hypothetical protein